MYYMLHSDSRIFEKFEPGPYIPGSSMDLWVRQCISRRRAFQINQNNTQIIFMWTNRCSKNELGIGDTANA